MARSFPFSIAAGLMVGLLAVVAAVNLWMMFRMHEIAGRTAATLSVLQYGRNLVETLSAQPLFRKPEADRRDWQAFARMAECYQASEQGLAYVTVKTDDVLLFHAHAGHMAQPPVRDRAPGGATNGRSKVRIGRKRLQVGDTVIPVITFAQRIRRPGAPDRRLELGLRHDVVAREQAGVTRAIRNVSRMALTTFGITFGICLVMVVGLVRYETRRHNRRRREENLAFAGAMAGGIIHDFRNPMSAMRLDLQMLCKEAGKAQAADWTRIRDLAERTRHTMDRLNAIFGEFLVLSRPDEQAPEDFDLAASVRDCTAILQPRFERSGVRVRFNVPPRGVWARGRPAQVKRAVLNVLNNAEHFSPQGGEVTVAVGSEGRHAEVTVADQGPGIPASARDKVFEMFYSQRTGGMGVGLALAKTAVDACGGTIDIDSGEHGGARVRIRLPSARRHGPARHNAQAREHERGEQT